MPYLTPASLVHYAWMALMLYWLASALKVKRMKYIAPAHVRIMQLVFLVPGCLLLFSERYRFGVLHLTVLPKAGVVPVIGVATTFVGVLFAIWARYILGSNWSSAVAIREDHELIQNGPYRLIRHPIYTGIIAAAWGTAIVAGELGAFVGVILITMGFAYKGKQEELNLQSVFGESWTAHRQRTGMFLPKMH
jgi:protein-S-isoprenylcysteine O-methyltransferase